MSAESLRKCKVAQRNDPTCSQVIEYCKIWSAKIKSDDGSQIAKKKIQEFAKSYEFHHLAIVRGIQGATVLQTEPSKLSNSYFSAIGTWQYPCSRSMWLKNWATAIDSTTSNFLLKSPYPLSWSCGRDNPRGDALNRLFS